MCDYATYGEDMYYLLQYWAAVLLLFIHNLFIFAA